MTFSGELPTDEESLEELERDIERTMLQQYGESMELEESQMEVVDLRSGSVIVVVVLKDKDDQTGANVTILVYQIEEDYKDGSLVIRYENEALVPIGNSITVDKVTGEEEDGFEFLWWYGLVIGVATAAIITAVIFTAIMLLVCCRKRSTRVKQVEENTYTAPVEMKKVPLD
jgi:hypothetical protein